MKELNPRQPYDWETYKQALIDSGLVADRAMERGVSLQQYSAYETPPQVYADDLCGTPTGLFAVKTPEQYLQLLWWPVLNESAVVIDRVALLREANVVTE